MEDNLKYFNLEGVKLMEEDFELAEEKVEDGMSIEDACDEVLSGIRECLDEGLEDFDEDEDCT